MKPFCFYTALGSGIWVVIRPRGYYIGDNQELIHSEMRRITYGLLAICRDGRPIHLPVQQEKEAPVTPGKEPRGEHIHRPSWLYLRLRGLPRHLHGKWCRTPDGGAVLPKGTNLRHILRRTIRRKRETDSCWDGIWGTRHGVCLAKFGNTVVCGTPARRRSQPFPGSVPFLSRTRGDDPDQHRGEKTIFLHGHRTGGRMSAVAFITGGHRAGRTGADLSAVDDVARSIDRVCRTTLIAVKFTVLWDMRSYPPDSHGRAHPKGSNHALRRGLEPRVPPGGQRLGLPPPDRVIAGVDNRRSEEARGRYTPTFPRKNCSSWISSSR